MAACQILGQTLAKPLIDEVLVSLVHFMAGAVVCALSCAAVIGGYFVLFSSGP